MRRLALLLPLLLAGGCVARERVERIEPRDPVTPAWVAEAVKVAPDDDVIAEIRSQGVRRRVETDEIVELKRAGVSDAVILALVKAEVAAPATGVVRRYVSYAPDWDTIGDVAVGTLYVLAQIGRIALELARCFCR